MPNGRATVSGLRASNKSTRAAQIGREIIACILLKRHAFMRAELANAKLAVLLSLIRCALQQGPSPPAFKLVLKVRFISKILPRSGKFQQISAHGWVCRDQR
jgi:hypothetical protein